MGEGIGVYLQELRIGQRLSTSQLAQKAGLRRATLSEWQSGKRQPRLAELEAVLNALGASDAQKQQARKRLSAPTHVLRLRAEAAAEDQELVAAVGGAPHGGDLIRAMRLRKGWTQAALAEQMAVSQATVVRWERAERWPDTEMLHTLCYLLGAHEEELTALTLGRFSLIEGQSALAEEAIRSQLVSVHATWHSSSGYALAELRLLSLISHAWPLAKQSYSGKRVLTSVLVDYVDHLFLTRRFKECYEAANRTLDLCSTIGLKGNHTDRIAIRLAETSVLRGSQQGLDSAFCLLQQWLSGTTNPVYVGWILRDLAQFKVARGDYEAAISLGREAMQRTEGVGSYDYLHRCHDFVRLLLQIGRVQEAQEVVEASDMHPYYKLVRAETFGKVGEKATAHQLIGEVLVTLDNPAEVITQPEIAFYRPVVETFAEQLEEAGTGYARGGDVLSV